MEGILVMDPTIHAMMLVSLNYPHAMETTTIPELCVKEQKGEHEAKVGLHRCNERQTEGH